MGTKRPSQKAQDYEQAMASQGGAERSSVSGVADPFADYSLSDFMEELAILEALGKAWKMKFCQATMGFSRRPGGLWIAYDDAGNARSVLHVEQFIGEHGDWPQINFWAEHIATGVVLSERYKLPFVVVAQFKDGRFAVRFDKKPEYVTTIGSRVAKGAGYPDAVNLVSYFDIEHFSQIGGKRESAKA